MKLNPLFNRKTVLRRMASLLLVGAAAVAFQGVAYAHHIIVTASVACSNGAAIISYTAISWDQGNKIAPGDGDNPAINVTFNGVTVDTRPFISSTTPPDQFSGMLPWPAATPTVDVSANTTSLWGDGFNPINDGPTNVVTLNFPAGCAPPPGIGRFTGGGKQVTINLADGSPVEVTKGFEVDCDLHTPSNNLEINWEGNQFHMTAFTAAVCTKPGIPNPPTAPVNRIDGTGTGRFDGVDGYTVMFTLIDNGEPGKNDETGFLIFQTSNPSNVVLNVALNFITTGNIQAHVDQQ